MSQPGNSWLSNCSKCDTLVSTSVKCDLVNGDLICLGEYEHSQLCSRHFEHLGKLLEHFSFRFRHESHACSMDKFILLGSACLKGDSVTAIESARRPGLVRRSRFINLWDKRAFSHRMLQNLLTTKALYFKPLNRTGETVSLAVRIADNNFRSVLTGLVSKKDLGKSAISILTSWNLQALGKMMTFWCCPVLFSPYLNITLITNLFIFLIFPLRSGKSYTGKSKCQGKTISHRRLCFN